MTIVHVMAGMGSMYKLYVCYLEHSRWMCVEVVLGGIRILGDGIDLTLILWYHGISLY